MNLKEFAKTLNGREYGNELTKDEELLLKENRCVAIFGYSDDNLEIRGYIDDELLCFNKEETRDFYLDGKNKKVFEEGFEDDIDEDYFKKIVTEYISKLPNFFVESEGTEGFTWYFSTEMINHEVFEIYDEGNKFCRGILIDLSYE